MVLTFRSLVFQEPVPGRLDPLRRGPSLQFADGNGAGAQRDGLERVAAAHDTAIENDFRPAADSIDDFGSMSMVAAVVPLASTVIET